MNVLLVAAEANPFIKSGGLGDVVGALPKAFREKGVEARVVIPKYKGISYDYAKNFTFKAWFTVPVGHRQMYCGIFEYYYNGITYYFLDNEYYFGRDGMYGYYDDAERFAFFDRAVLMFMKVINWEPDIIHCNDWQTGMVPVLYRLEYSKDPFYWRTKNVYSIHNLLFQGVFDPKILPDLFGYSMEQYNNGALKFDDGVSFMKGGINYADKVTTVSYTYAQEVQTPEYGERLDAVLRSRSCAFCGILNGIDYDEYNPYTDKEIYRTFEKDFIEDKQYNKMQLQKDLGLPVNADTPMISIVSRLTRQKGIDLVKYMLERLLPWQDVQIVILGTGDRDYEEYFWNLQDRYRNKVSANIKFDNNLAHKIYASSDMYLMPSKFEPCGLGQLIALRYGTIPIVRETGGLKDTVNPYNEYTGIGNGFSFRNFNGDELLHTTEYALKMYWDRWRWKGIVNQAMNSDNSWSKSADSYIGLYNEIVSWPF